MLRDILFQTVGQCSQLDTPFSCSGHNPPPNCRRSKSRWKIPNIHCRGRTWATSAFLRTPQISVRKRQGSVQRLVNYLPPARRFPTERVQASWRNLAGNSSLSSHKRHSPSEALLPKRSNSRKKFRSQRFFPLSIFCRSEQFLDCLCVKGTLALAVSTTSLSSFRSVI